MEWPRVEARVLRGFYEGKARPPARDELRLQQTLQLKPHRVASLWKPPSPFPQPLIKLMKTFLPLLALFALTGAGAAAEVKAPRPELALPRTAEYDYDIPEPGTYSLPVLKPAADGTVLRDDDKPVRLHELAAGRITILSFIYTRCTDPRACLRASGVLRQLQQLTLAESVV